jgi:hypothetical protein
MAAPFVDLDFLDVSLLPMWHGIKTDQAVDYILRGGFVNLTSTDKGFFGHGIYNTFEAEYAFNVYANKGGPLFLNWVSFHAVCPIMDEM